MGERVDLLCAYVLSWWGVGCGGDGVKSRAVTSRDE